MHHQYSSRFGLRSELCSEVCVRRAAQQEPFFQPACPCTHSPGSQSIRVFSHFFFSLDGRCRRHLFSLSCVGADFVAPSSQRSRRECWGKRSSAFFSRTSSRQHPRGNFPQFLPQDSRDGRCPGNLARSYVTLLRSPSFSADWSMSCEFCSLVAIFPSDIEFSPSKQTS